MASVHVQLIEPCDWSAANDLHNNALGDTRTLEEWCWEFGGPRGEPPLFAVAEVQGQILGTQAVIPVEMRDRRGIFLTGKSEETYVAPSIRGLGVLEQMYSLVFEECRRRHIDVLWGFTPATKAFLRTGFSSPWHTQQLVFPLTATGIRHAAGWSGGGPARIGLDAVGLLSAAGSKSAWRATQLLTESVDKGGRKPRFAYSVSSQIPSDCEPLARRFADRWGLATINRSAEYMDWRVTRNPHVKARVVECRDAAELVGWCLYAVDVNSNGYVIDMVAACRPDSAGASSERHVVRGLFLRAIEGMRAAGAGSIRMWTNRDSDYERMVRRTAQSVGFWRIRRGESSVFLNLGADQERFTRVVNGLHSRLSTEGRSG